MVRSCPALPWLKPVNSAAQTPLFRLIFQQVESGWGMAAPQKKADPIGVRFESTGSCQEETSKNAFLPKRRSGVVSAAGAGT
jgi:hypothetical protein